MSNELLLPYLVADKARTDPDLDVLTFEDHGIEEVRSYRQLQDNALRIALALHDAGVQPGDRLALLMHNHPEFVETMVAAGILGAVVVPIDARTRGHKLAFMLRDAGCGGVVCGHYALGAVAECAPTLPALRWLLCWGTAREDISLPKALSLMHFDAVYRLPVVPRDIATRSEQDVMQIMYTSGTTGDPKGVVVRHARFAFVARQGELVFGYRLSDRPYNGLSLTHGNAQFLTLAPALKMGLRAVFSRKFTKSRLWDVLRRHGCTTFTLLGGMTTAIYSEPPRPDDADNPVRLVISAGMPKAIWDAFARRFDVQIFEFYGAVEGGMTINPIGEGPVGSCGRVPPGLVAKVVDEAGHQVPPDVPGELWFRPADGSAPVVEYFNNPAASAAKTAGGWLHSGDVVSMDAQGWVTFLYRLGGAIRRNGDFVNPAFLEKTLAEHPQISDVHVFGVPNASGAPGEMDVVAAVVPTDADAFDAASVFAWCRRQLEANMLPGYLMTVADLPRTASEKIQPRFLAEIFNARSVPVFTE